MDLKNLFVYWKNHQTFQIKISKKKTLLDLKKAIANHFNENYTGFILMNGNFLYDSTKNSKTIEELNIERVVRLPVNYNPGDGQIF